MKKDTTDMYRRCMKKDIEYSSFPPRNVPMKAANGVGFLNDPIFQIGLLGSHHCKVITKTLPGRHESKYIGEVAWNWIKEQGRKSTFGHTCPRSRQREAGAGPSSAVAVGRAALQVEGDG